jgi:ferrous iron transport protein B
MMAAESILQSASQARASVQGRLHEAVAGSLYHEAERIAARAVVRQGEARKFAFDLALDRVLTSRTWGLPAMGLMLASVLWITVAGANVPSAMLDDLLIGRGHPWLQSVFAGLGSPAWLTGLLVDGVYLATAWVVSVMLPPMAVFFPLFTLLEDYGYLPRVAFNLDRAFRWAGAQGKQSLTMMMGFGCNAAGVVSTRIIQSPRERLIAILTNNFSICNGRWPTLILMGTIFVAATAPPALAGLVAAGSVLAIAVLGVLMTLLASRVLSRTVLKGESSHFSLELPPYRPPQIGRVIVRSIFDRTLIVLWRAVVMAAPAGALIWLTSNVFVGGDSLAGWFVSFLDPIGVAVGLNGVILAAYVFAIPANEIIVPTIIMLTLNIARSSAAGTGVMLEMDDQATRDVLVTHGGWTLLTGVNLMLFSLLHNPCSTTLLTIYRETKSLKWTLWSALLPVALGFLVCGAVAVVWRLVS